MYFSKSTGGFYLSGVHVIPDDAVEISKDHHDALMQGQSNGRVISSTSDGLPILIDPPPHIPTADDLCTRIDTAADTARRAVAGDPLRAVEYDRARAEAEQFAAANYQGDAPPMVAAWAINGRTAQDAADDILHEAAQYTAALIALRETRLAAKEQVRNLMGAGEVEQAQQVVEQTVAAIEAAVAGIGNNAA